MKNLKNLEKNVIEQGMYCPRCNNKMKETKGTHHKKKKWLCPNCGKIRFTILRKKEK